MENNNLHLMKPTTAGQIYELWVAGKLEDKDFNKALTIVGRQVDMLVKMLTECEQHEVEVISYECEKYKDLYKGMLASRKPMVQGQEAAECLKLAEKNWNNAAVCENPDEQLVYLERCLGYACVGGVDPFDFIVEKVKESTKAA